ncbi:hypothetical protein [Lysinibacillus xylanilyticus]|uniref:hypothetical protein n=1 Tax=Lysinibacillus xylanilyticus TaxID=582475 RepID=UPI0036D8140E
MNPKSKGSNREMVALSAICVFLIVLFAGGFDSTQSSFRDSIKAWKDGKAPEFEYYLGSDGYITKVIITDKDYKTVIDGKEYIIAFKHIDGKDPSYEVDSANKIVTLYSSQYPSERYRN